MGDDMSFSKVEGLTPEVELAGNIKIAKTAKPTAALARFEFYDANFRPIHPARITQQHPRLP